MIGERQGFALVVGDEHDGCSHGGEQRVQFANKPVMEHTVKGGEWFIETQHPRARRQRASKGNPLRLPT